MSSHNFCLAITLQLPYLEQFASHEGKEGNACKEQNQNIEDVWKSVSSVPKGTSHLPRFRKVHYEEWPQRSEKHVIVG